MELEDKVYEKIVKLCERGDFLAEQEKYDEAVKIYLEALELVPFPKEDWEASTWIYTAIGDSYYMNENYEEAVEYFYDAMNCPDGITNSFILLRQGQAMYELKSFEKAKEFLLRAYMLDGKEIFKSEEKKYFKFLKKNVEGIYN